MYYQLKKNYTYSYLENKTERRKCGKDCTTTTSWNEYKVKTKQPDGRHKNEPIWTPKERLMMVESNKNVDQAFLYDGEPALYEYLSENVDWIDVRILGEDHRGKPFTGDDLSIEIIFNSRDHDYSTTNTIAKIIKERV